MRIFFIIIACISWQFVVSQNMQIASNYYNQAQFEKALSSFQLLYKQNPANSQAVIGMVKCYRQLERYTDAVNLLETSFAKNPIQPLLSLELGVTHYLNKNDKKAQEAFEKTYTLVDENPNRGSYLAHFFKEYNLLEPAITCLKKSMLANENLDYNLEIASMYGEMGKYPEMFDSYLNHLIKKPDYINIVKRRLDDFISDDEENESNIIFRKTVLKKNQKDPNYLYDDMLSWLFVQQKQYRKAFLQQKAIYLKTNEGMLNIINLSMIAKNAKEYETAKEILNFVIENTEIDSYKINAHQQSLEIYSKTATKKEYESVNKKYERIIELFGKEKRTLQILLDYGHFLGFTQDRKEDAIAFLKPLLKKRFNKIDIAQIQILLGDVLVLNNKFNQALIYYTKAQKSVKNHPLSQEASFKIAKASYYKGDFDWAKTQLNVLKASTTQLVANDAMELSLLIDDNTQEDSTHAALKLFSKAELYTFQEQPEKAIATYQEIIDKHIGESTEDDALFKQAILFEEAKNTDAAIKNYAKIIRLFPTSLLIDDTYFKLGMLYINTEKPEEAKPLLENIIFNHADSIHYVEARKAYRKLRGDVIVN